MSLPVRSLALLAIAAATTVGAQAQTITKRKPGLWEVQTTTSIANMPNMQELLANVPPEQRAMMEKMMKDQGVGMGAKPNSFRFCMTKEQAERTEMAVNPDPETQCSNKMTPVSSSEAKFSFNCKRKDGSTMQGEGRAHGLTAEGYAMDMKMKMQQPGQGPTEMQMSQKARWVGADCGGLKPMNY